MSWNGLFGGTVSPRPKSANTGNLGIIPKIGTGFGCVLRQVAAGADRSLGPQTFTMGPRQPRDLARIPGATTAVTAPRNQLSTAADSSKTCGLCNIQRTGRRCAAAFPPSLVQIVRSAYNGWCMSLLAVPFHVRPPLLPRGRRAARARPSSGWRRGSALPWNSRRGRDSPLTRASACGCRGDARPRCRIRASSAACSGAKIAVRDRRV
jgi:hypothetical protein